jgi:CheY-like chemotaxis protein
MAPTILVCDNEAPLRALVRATLDDGRYEIVEARDGDAALELTRRLRPSLILLDMMMPGRSGLEVLTELREDPGLAATPVIMLTARAQAADREAVADAGADRFLAKPFSPLELISVVEDLLGTRT